MWPMPIPDQPDAWERWVRATDLHAFVLAHPNVWPLAETVHFIGLSLLIGTVGLFDLRVLGMAKAIPPGALHKLIPVGVAGFFLNAMTGVTFFSAFPEQYAYNAAFFWKLVFMTIAGLNVAVFYLSPAFREVKRLPAGGDAPFRAKLIAGISLGCWIGVMSAGRFLTFFRPPIFH